MTWMLRLVQVLATAADDAGGALPPIATDNTFFVFIIVMTSLAVMLLLVLLILLAVKMNVIMKRLDEISDSANQFLAMGVKHFSDKKHH